MSLKYTLVILALALACLVVSPTQAAITSAERKATLKFLQEFLDEYKDQLKPLWTGNDYCSWSGVTCDANDDVHVNLSGRGLRGDLPEPKKKEGSLIRIVSIDLSHNPGLDGDFESDWKCLTSLAKIDLSYTSLKGYIPDQWRAMSGLQEVRIHHTAACRNLPDWSAATMPNLRVVDVSYNNFYGSIRGDWASFGRLQQLDISGNNFCSCTPASWLSVPVLANAAAQTAMASPTCVYNSCANAKNCPKTPNAGGGVTVPTATVPPTTTAKPTPTTTKPAATTAKPAPTTTKPTATTTKPAPSTYHVPTYNVLVTLARAFPSKLSGWTGTDYCSWSGITCNAANGEVYVQLQNYGLSGALSDTVSSADGAEARIVSIELNGNSGITGGFPATWANLKHLRQLDLSSTSLSGYLPSGWNGMTSIQSIRIVSTRACGGLPNWAMPTLLTIDLSNNRLKGTLASSWTAMTSLTQATLSGNSFCGCAPSSWVGHSALQAAISTTANAAALRATTCGSTNRCTYANFLCS